MAEQSQKLLDVWLVQANTVYRQVPYTVVVDWLQQGRLLGDDRVRPAGGKNWFPLEKVPAFQSFLPKAPALALEDSAEALEMVDLGLRPTKRIEGEDEDVDMIPLIDISLVLLIFFMMTASISQGLLSFIKTPGAEYQTETIAKGMYWLGIEPTSRAGAKVKDETTGATLPWCSYGQDAKELIPPTATNLANKNVDRPFLTALAKTLADQSGEVRIRIRADRDTPIETIKDITQELQSIEARLKPRLKIVVTGEVSEAKK